MALTQADLQGIEQILEPKFSSIEQQLKSMNTNIETLTDSVDGLLHIVRRHEQEWLVLQKQHEKIRDILVKKGIATEDEMAIA